ncbi:DNRLRE domain-containing protein, partial [Clostridium sp.]
MGCESVYSKADTFVSSKYPNKNYSKESRLFVGQNSDCNCEGDLVKTLMKFDLPEWVCGCKVSEAEIRIYVEKVNVSCESKGLYVDLLYNLDSFYEEYVTYKTAPFTS